MKNEPSYAPKIDWLQDQCPIKATVDVTGGRWKPLILFYLLDQPKRFSALRKDIPSVTAQMLTLQVDLERTGPWSWKYPQITQITQITHGLGYVW
jgi:DNA-binding HxlR family transcriptional regulator